MTQWQPGMRITADRLNAGTDPTEITTGLTAASGWSVTQFNGRRVGQNIYIAATIMNVSATLQITANSGNIVSDPVIATLPAGWWPTETLSTNWDNGTVEGGAVINTNGTISLRTITYNGTVTANSNLRFTFSWTLPAA